MPASPLCTHGAGGRSACPCRPKPADDVRRGPGSQPEEELAACRPCQVPGRHGMTVGDLGKATAMAVPNSRPGVAPGGINSGKNGSCWVSP